MTRILSQIGIKSERIDKTLLIDPKNLHHEELPQELVHSLRASFFCIGPLLARLGKAKIPLPGGCQIGIRPINEHIRGLRALGARVKLEKNMIISSIPENTKSLKGANLSLNCPSVGATETLLMAATLAEGNTTINNAAREPEISDLADFLNQMGAEISGAGRSVITITGVKKLHPAEHTVIPDRIEAATYLAALGVAGGEIEIKQARADHMDMLIRKLNEMGMCISPSVEGLQASADKRLDSVDISTLPYPGVATDYKPLFVAMLSVAEGVGIVTENIFSGRFRYADELVRIGADIRIEGHHAVVRGLPALSGAPVRAHDIRAGAALVVAGLAAEGETRISDAYHISRGYQDLVGNLRSLGANISYS